MADETNIKTTEGDPVKKVEDPKKPATSKPDDSYKAMPFKDYIEHTSTIEGGDPDFKKMFPKEKEEQQNKREEDFRGKYGEYAANHSWMGDVYNKPVGGSKDRLGDVVLSTAKESGVDPKTLLGSFMEEGGYKLTYGAKDAYPASTLGLEDLDKDYDKIKKYLPEGFKDKFETQKDDKRSVPVFKDPKDMTTALAGYLNYYKDEVGKAAKAKGIKLSPQAESFFTQAAYNSSKGLKIDNASKMMDYYKLKGLLKDDKFLTEDSLGKDKYGGIYENTRRRIDSINALEKEGSIDLSEKRQKFAKQGTWTKDVHGTLKDSKQGRVFDLPSDKFNFNVLILKDGKKKVLPKGQSPDNVDVTKLKDLDEYDIDANKS